MTGSTDEPLGPQAGDQVDVAVIGAGQAGLAIGYFLRRQGRRFAIVDRADAIGSAWRERWESLTLFTPRRYSALPGLPFPGDPDGYPTRDELTAYLERYAEAVELPVELTSEVTTLERGDEGRFRLEVAGRTIVADQVVVATGPFQTPYVPTIAESLADNVFQTHAVGYRRPDDVPAGTVLVVGGGNTGFQIAKELSSTHKVLLSVGSRQKPLPQRVLGRDLFWWLTKTRILDKTADSRLGRRLRTRDTLIGSSPRELRKRYRVELRPRVVAADGRTIRCDDGSELEVDAVIWATGYRADYSWIKLPILGEDGRLRHRRGVTEIPGLTFLGLTWQHTRGSALIGWVKDDAEFIAERIAEFHGSKARQPGEDPISAGHRPRDACPKGGSHARPRRRTTQPDNGVLARDRGPSGGRQGRAGRARRGEGCRLEIIPVKKRIGDATVRMLAYNSSVPGSTLRVPQGATTMVHVTNHGDLETTVHWHGLRLENRFDGTHETQAPIPVGGMFSYRLEFPDPGVYWYHPHIRQDYGQELGLYGNILVTPQDPMYWPSAHRELVLTLDDVLVEDGRIAPFSRSETTYAAMGRFGNVLLVGGETELSLTAKTGELIRLYLTNTANTRVFNVALPGARLKLVGGDSGRVEHERFVDSVVLAPSERVVLDVLLPEAGQLTLEHRTPEKTYRLATIDIGTEAASPSLEKEFETTAGQRRVDHRARAPDDVLRCGAGQGDRLRRRDRNGGAGGPDRVRVSDASRRRERTSRGTARSAG